MEGALLYAEPIKVSEMQCAAGSPCGGDAIVVVRQKEGHEVARDGDRKVLSAGGEATFYFELSRTSGHWQITHAELFPPPQRR